MRNPRVLIVDIETRPLEAFIWDLKEQYVNLNQIKVDWCLMAVGAKWLGDPASKTMYWDVRKCKSHDDDTPLLKALWNLLNEADIVITQNGERFDGPKINARLILSGFKPYRPYRHLDTYKIAKKIGAFTSHSLEYLTDKLCTKYKKLSHKKFPGLSLWKECLKGNIDAWEEMKRYNINDVLSTEELYTKLMSWAPESFATPYDGTDRQCATCGVDSLIKDGVANKKKLKYQRWHCTSCGVYKTGERVK